ncbi:hypothetical protein, partial [Sediminibacterium salmoneum]|uniref:hypothetical protein n=1 Tax=Sediminibacterium salmoneum TaxID=426421 RepID=UPI001C122A23
IYHQLWLIVGWRNLNVFFTGKQGQRATQNQIVFFHAIITNEYQNRLVDTKIDKKSAPVFGALSKKWLQAIHTA